MGITAKADVLSTRQVAQLLGVGEATVKRWADAGEIDCFRTPGGHRKFRLRDVTSFVQRKQFDAAGPLPGSLPAGVDQPGPAATSFFMDTALHGDAAALVAHLSALRLRGVELEASFDLIVRPALAQVGERWQECKLSVAEEHVASQAVIDAIARAQPLAEPPGEPVRPDKGVAVVAAVAGELHDIGARMAACLLRARGFEVLAPLAQTPARDLAELIVRSRAKLVALSSTLHREPDLLTEQLSLAAKAAAQVGGRVIAGGAGLRGFDAPDGVRILDGMQALAAEAEQAGRRRARA